MQRAGATRFAAWKGCNRMPLLLMTSQALTMIATLLVGAALIAVSSRAPARFPILLAYGIGLILAAALFALAISSTGHEALVLSSLAFCVVILLPLLIYLFALELAAPGRSRTFTILGLAAVLTAIIVILFWNQAQPGAFLSQPVQAGSASNTVQGVWASLYLVYACGIQLGAGILLLTYAASNRVALKLQPLAWIWGAILLAILIEAVGLGRLILLPNLETILLASAVMGLALLLFSRSRFQQMDVHHLSRDMVFEGWADGVMILNEQNQIIDLNPAAAHVLGVSIQDAYGKDVDQFLTNWNSLIQNSNTRDLEFKGSVNFNQQWRYFNVRLFPLQNHQGQDIAKTIILRDMTDRKTIAEIRQRARDEMFTLLHSFYNAASGSKTTNDFLKDALYQIAYSFNIQDSAIHLVDPASDNENSKLTLTALHGPLMQPANSLSTLYQKLDILNWIIENKQPLIVRNAKQDPRFAGFAQQEQNLSIAIFPMLNDQKVLGIMMIARTQLPGLGPDEIIRLNVVAEELASFIYTERQKQMSIAMAERERLVRDLHDSITQKLYGMVTMTEAFQAELESGKTSNTTKFMTRISENARLALKEMRLFLHQMRPVDLEHEGLVAVLRQRLDYVEGQSDIQARLIADDNIAMPTETELILYYIAQEALNNILKHARAKSVLIRLKSKRHAISLEITDNGCGFDPNQVEANSMGIKNMYMRAGQINAKIKITSAKGKGTKISLSVPQ
jgi:PAS domain S-box-containing protein